MLDLLSSPWALVALFVFLSYTTEAMTGFGSIVIALSLGVMVLPLEGAAAGGAGRYRTGGLAASSD